MRNCYEKKKKEKKRKWGLPQFIIVFSRKGYYRTLPLSGCPCRLRESWTPQLERNCWTVPQKGWEELKVVPPTWLKFAGYAATSYKRGVRTRGGTPHPPRPQPLASDVPVRLLVEFMFNNTFLHSNKDFAKKKGKGSKADKAHWQCLDWYLFLVAL
jgi:hypothetical protein